MPSTIAICKFVGCFSLGLLTGVPYTLSTQSLPSLLTLPSARPAAYTLAQTTRLSTLHIRALSFTSALSLALAYYLSPPRVKHPYLLWTSLASCAAGGLSYFNDRRAAAAGGAWEEVEMEEGVNGEQVEKRAREQQLVEAVRAGVGGAGFAMVIVGIWGDGA